MSRDAASRVAAHCVRHRGHRCGAARRRPRKSRCGKSGWASARSRFRTIAAPTRRSVYPVPVPYFVYRGQFLKADRDGVRGELFDRDIVELSFSVNAHDSGEQRRQRCAPAACRICEPTLELGPSLEVHLWRSAGRGQ